MPTSTPEPLSYPLGLTCTRIHLYTHTASVRIRNLHQSGSPHIRYIYAVEMHPYNPALPTFADREIRQLRALIHYEASRIIGLTLKQASHPWPFSPQSTLLADPLAPTR